MTAAYPAQSLGPNRIRVGDFLKSEWDPRYNRDAATIKNPGTEMLAGALMAGFPIKLVGSQWVIVLAGDEANIGGFFLGMDAQAIPEALATNAITALKYPILVGGPALINLDAMPASDPSGGAYTLATVKTRVEALNPPIRVLRQPTATSTQTN